MDAKISNPWKKRAAKFPVIGIFALLAWSMPCIAADAGSPVAFRTIGADEYQSFIGNWDEKKTPVLCAAIRSPAEWEAIFHPAAFGLGRNTQKKPFGPDAKIFEKEQLLIVARVITAPDGKEEPMKITGIIATGDELTVNYAFTAPINAASYTIKSFAGAFVPKRDYSKITFIENGNHAATLDLKKGQWSVPEINISKRGAP